MTLRHLSIFQMVCKENSVTKAAKKLYLSQPAVSLAVKELEEYYGVKLFDRLSRRLYLTEAGKRMYDYAVHINALVGEMEELFRDWDKAGGLRVGTSITIGTYFIAGYVKEFQEMFPQITPLVTVNSSEIIEQMVLADDLDLGLVEGTVRAPELLVTDFMEDSLVPICAPNSPLAQSGTVSLAQVKKQYFLLREKNSGTRQIVDSVFYLQGFSVEPIWESTSTKAIVDGVANGIGISILPYRLVTGALEERRIAQFQIEECTFQRQFHLIYHKNKYLTPAMQAFMGLCK